MICLQNFMFCVGRLHLKADFVGTATPSITESTPNTSSEDVSMATDTEDEETKVQNFPFFQLEYEYTSSIKGIPNQQKLQSFAFSHRVENMHYLRDHLVFHNYMNELFLTGTKILDLNTKIMR